MRIDDFSDDRSVRAWRPVNDIVMGGRSRSAFVHDASGIGVFSGTVSLENHGGFASVRRSVEPESLRGFEGVELRVRGDGKRCRFHVSGQTDGGSGIYRHEFATSSGEWVVVRLPFAAMELSVRGYRPPNAQPLPPERVRSIGLMIADGQEGAFRLEVDSIRAYCDSKPQ